MKKVLVCREKDQLETRVAMIPDDIKKLTAMGYEFVVVSGAGLKSGFSDEAYTAAGAKIVKSEEEAYEDSEIVVRVMKPESTKGLKKDTLHISYFDPFHEKELLQEVAEQGIQLVSLEMIPRTTLAQKMDVQSSQTSLAGYVAVSDLTRAGNLIRNNTYDAVNPLMVVALTYLAIVVFLTQLLGILERRLAKSDKR